MQGFPPAGGVLPKEKKAEIALIVLGIVQKKFRGLGPICMCIYRKCSQYVGRPRSEFSGRRRGAGGGRRARIPAGFLTDSLRIPYENWETLFAFCRGIVTPKTRRQPAGMERECGGGPPPSAQ